MKYRLILFFCAVSLLLICLWQHMFHLPAAVIGYHMLVMVPVHVFCISAIALIYRQLLTRRWYLVVKIGSYVLLLSLFYVLIFGSMRSWGDIITVKILSTYIKGFRSFLRSLPFSLRESEVVIGLFCLLPYLLTLLFIRPLERACADLGNAPFLRKKPLIAIAVLLLLASPLAMKLKRTVHKGGEPVMVMLFDHMWGVTDNPLFSQRRIKVGFSDQQERKEYAAHKIQPLRKNVILIIVDAMRADHLSAYGYGRKTTPFLDGLIASDKAVKIDRCYSTCACTLCGVTSILLSRTWNDCAVNGFNIIGLLHDEGYRTHALISGAHKEWYNMAKFYSDDCDYYDGKDAKKYYFKDDRVLLEGMDRIGHASDTPAFFYFHMQSTHETGLLQDKYTVYQPFKKSITTQGMNGEAAVNEYDDKVLQADDMIRQLFEALDRKGYLKNSMVIITADHGQGLGEHGVSGHVDWLYDPQVSVPLIIYDDSLALYRQRTVARHIDIAPTIVDRLGLPQPRGWMGLSLLHDSIATYSYHETGKNGLETGLQKYMIVYTPQFAHGDTASQRIYKYIFTAKTKQEELYEVVSDPGELHNLVESNKDILSLLQHRRRHEKEEMFGND